MALAVLLTACTSEPRNSRTEMTPQLSAQQVIDKVLVATRDIRSFQDESTSSIRPGQDHWWKTQLRLRDGPDGYVKATFGENPDTTHESLFYRGIPYNRDSSSHWASTAPADWDAADQEGASDFTLAGRDDTVRAAMIYGIQFESMSSPTRLADEVIDGKSVLRIHAEYSAWTSFPASALWPEESDSGEDPDFDLEGAGTIDLWVDPATYRLVRFDIVLAPVEEGTEARAYSSSIYSRYNEAELPGPLPE